MFDLIKTFLITYVLTRPTLWVAVLVGFSALLFLLAIFIRFKNGWLSWVGFFIVEIIGVLAVLSLTKSTFYEDNLRLDKGEVKVVQDVDEYGVILERRFRSKSNPLLGISLPDKSTNYYQPAKDRILNSRFNGKLFVYKSSAYPGVVLYDAERICINEALLREGLAYVSGSAPQQYVNLQKRASETKQGIWSSPVVSFSMVNKTSFVDLTVLWLIVVQSVTIAMVVVTCLKRRLN